MRVLIEVLGGLFFIFFTFNQSTGHSIVIAFAELAGAEEYLVILTLNYILMLIAGIILLGLANYESRELDTKFVIATGIIFLGGLIFAVSEFLSHFS